MRHLFMLLLLLALTPALAQTHIDLGIKGGISIPNLHAGNSDNPINTGYSSRVGPDFGVHAEFHLTRHFSLQPQLEYSAQGGKKNGAQAFTPTAEQASQFPSGQVPQYLYANYKSEAKFNYLMVPILAKYGLDLSEHWRFYVGAGPFVSFLLNAKNVTSGSSMIYTDPAHTQPITPAPVSFDHTENIKDELKKTNVGIAGHVGFAYSFGRSSIFVEGGGNYGFIKIQRGETNGNNNTGAGNVDIGYAFRLR
ncbi:hypothetical protein DCC81_19450 [Chitinophaga parva]|uniref:Outer membrane protein beta-barrel domain-containing protein n=1 Tax=Chitinophaga parva TaxID=2169414 RepID=A0A2T7BBZ9_9BACT|nr:porin family protein [Chitinophaga parva]PUZ22612.1 hypothetical protein DCC81_19450 [Chitinophaga parva]